MSAVARFLARFTWWWCLWLMRRPWMKALQRRSRFLFPPDKRGKAHESFIKQNAFARRNGVRILTGAYSIMLGIFVIEIAYSVALNLYVSGFFNVPDSVSRRLR